MKKYERRVFYVPHLRYCNVRPRTVPEGPDGDELYSSTLPSTSTLDGGGWSTPRSGRFSPGKDPVPIVQEAGWAPRPVWTNAENLAPTGIRYPDRPVCRESLYRLSYRGPSELFYNIFMTLKSQLKVLYTKSLLLSPVELFIHEPKYVAVKR